jgi:hypothetical protein
MWREVVSSPGSWEAGLSPMRSGSSRRAVWRRPQASPADL